MIQLCDIISQNKLNDVHVFLCHREFCMLASVLGTKARIQPNALPDTSSKSTK